MSAVSTRFCQIASQQVAAALRFGDSYQGAPLADVASEPKSTLTDGPRESCHP